ncbi:hypothetical protein [Wenzhouxiangella limi]|uniref:Transcription-repair coupling factor n=1 Tax=Wenzhouxiangella limi TaxID=2707351 RepID=A0A845V0U7_9GAMM|nr:hypothetical protein [Wenzhouxiangella limi]NDY96202.1 hypothetical protein [Wenzhouxiangella limi]
MDHEAAIEYITTEELSARIKYDPRTIRSQLKDSVLIEGIHYIRPFGQRKILFIWQTIERDMVKHSVALRPVTPREQMRVIANG